jgi:dihydrodipicolinate synthase/N-acetylneuraminate lyase
MNLSAALEVVDFLVAHGMKGIALFGATGEFPHFATEDRIRLAHMAIKRSRVPVIVNATHSCLADALAIADHAASNGASALLIQPPTYFRYGADDIREYLVQFLRQTSPDLPVLLYNLPAFNNAIPIAVAQELLESGAAAGIKDSSGDWDYLSRLLESRQRRPFRLLVGNDTLTARGRAAGADGSISGCGCAIPELLVALDNAIAGRCEAKAARLAALLAEFVAWVQQFPGPAAIREAMQERGFKVGVRAVPLAPETEQRAAAFRAWFHDWLPGMQRECAA